MKPEDAMQCAYFEWVNIAAKRYPILKYAYHCPNEIGTRNKVEVFKLARMGVRRGVPDVFIPATRGGFAGLYIEFKVKKNVMSADQREYMAALSAEGYRCAVVRDDWEIAKDMTLAYLQGKIKRNEVEKA